MKKSALLFFIVVASAITSCKRENTAPSNAALNGKFPVMTFTEKEHDFGTIQQGDKVEHIFKFTNSGESDLIISDAKGSCGCTIPDYPKEPIQPGEGGEIKVSFNSAGKSGQQTKTVTLNCNTKKGTEILTIKSNIELPKGEN